MPANEDTSLEVATQIRDMLRSQNELYLAQARLMRGQLAMMEALAEAQGTMTDNLQNGFNSAEEQIAAAEAAMQQFQTTGQGAMGSLSTGAAGTADAIDSLGDSLVQAGDSMQRLGMGGIILESLQKGFNATKAAIGGIGGIIGEVLGGIRDLGTTIIGAVLSPFEALFKQAAKAVGNNEYKRAIEELRASFGELTTNEGAAVLEMFRSLRGELGDTGLRTRRILGPPAEQLKYMTALAKSFGSQFNMVFNEGLIENAGNIVAFKKALDLSDESMKTAARIAATTGRTIDAVLQEQANYAIQLGDAFGISSMVISRGMQEMENDMKHFGGLSKKTLAETTVYATKLGIEVKTLSGIMDAFDNFDSAADAAARLNQQFGIQIDALEMLREEDPAQRADMLRNSLNAAGVSYTDLDRRSKTYLASQLQISEAEAELLFNRNNQGLSLDQIKKKAGEAEKKHLSQAEVMERLSNAIERIVQQMDQMEEGLFENFFKGFNEGITNSRAMRALLNDVHQIMLQSLQAGRRLGRIFIDAFPGAMDIIKGFQELFNPRRWRKMFADIVGAFRDFFQTIETDPEAGLRTLMQRLQTAFFDNFTDGAAGGQRLIAGFRRFFSAILRVLLASVRVIVPMLLQGIRDGLREINEYLNSAGENTEFSQFFSDMKTVLGELFNELFTFFDNFFTNYGDDIWNAFLDLTNTIWVRLRPWLEEHWTEVVLGLGAFFAGPALLSALSNGLGALFTNAISRVFEGGIMGGPGGGAGGAAAAGAAAAGGESAAAGAAATAEASNSINAATASGGFEQMLTNVATILAANHAIQELMTAIYDFAERAKENEITAGDIAVAVGALVATGAIIWGMAELAGRIGQLPIAATAIAATLISVFAAFEAQNVMERFAIFVGRLTGENGLFRSMYTLITTLGGAGLSNAQQAAAIRQMQVGLLFLGGLTALLSDLLPMFTELASPTSDLLSGLYDAATSGGEGGEDPMVEAFRKAGLRLGQMIESVAVIGRIFEEKTQYLNTAENLTQRGLLFGAFVHLLGEVVESIFPPVETLLTSLQEGGIDFNQVSTVLSDVFSSMSGFINEVLTRTGDIPVERFATLGNILPLFNGFGEYLTTISRVGTAFKAAADGAPANIDTAVINTLILGLANGVGNLMWASRALANFSPEQIKAIAQIFTSAGTMMGNLSGIVTNLGNITIDPATLDTFSANAPSLTSALLTVIDIGRSFTPENLEALNTLNNISPTLQTASQNLVNINRALLPIATDTSENLRTRVGDLLGTVMDTVNAVNSIGSVGLATTLDALENNLGLGSNTAYTIRNQNFNLTINMKVVIDAARFENVFYRRAHEQEGGPEEIGGFNVGAFNAPTFSRRGINIPVTSGEE